MQSIGHRWGGTEGREDMVSRKTQLIFLYPGSTIYQALSRQLQNSYEEYPDEFILDDIKINSMNKEYLSVTPNEFKLEKSADGLVVLYRNEKYQAVSTIAYIF